MAAELPSTLRPHAKPALIELVKETGMDVSDWANYKNGTENPGANPRYCYNWYFDQDGIVIFNLCHHLLEQKDNSVVCELNLRKVAEEEKSPRKHRASDFDRCAEKCFENRLNVRVIIQRDKNEVGRNVHFRLLDDKDWHIRFYNKETGKFTIVRGGLESLSSKDVPKDQETIEFLEGEAQRRFIQYRKREAELREQKLAEHSEKHHGRLICEVPGCGFDFMEKYGELGKGYAHVHHKIPLGDAPPEGWKVTVDQLAVVCANCHAMIHRGGKCRELNEVIPVTAQ